MVAKQNVNIVYIAENKSNQHIKHYRNIVGNHITILIRHIMESKEKQRKTEPYRRNKELKQNII